MLKSETIIALHNYLNNNENGIDLDSIRAEVEHEYNITAPKVQARKRLYEKAYPVVMRVLNDIPMTAAEIYMACEDKLPDDFAIGRLSYGLTSYWYNDVIRIDNGKNPYTYVKR